MKKLYITFLIMVGIVLCMGSAYYCGAMMAYESPELEQQIDELHNEAIEIKTEKAINDLK